VTSLFAFVRLTRPLFLVGGFAGVALGAAVAAAAGLHLDVATYLRVQTLVTAFQLMVHYANDYFDRGGDAVDARTPWSGGSGVLPSGALPPRVALIAAIACALAGLLSAAAFTFAGNATAGELGIAIFVLAWSYSAPPLRLAARGLGEIATALVVAILVPAVAFAAFAGRLSIELVSATSPPALAMFAMMLAVELPDAGADLVAGKRTLVVRWGPTRTWPRIAVISLIAVATAAVGAYLQTPVTALALLPAAAVACGLFWAAFHDPRPARIAFGGVALYATLTAGLAVAYGVTAALR
jgi:1,4-dihydroxy-2-naphthoate octaprenyltransferase